jgi:hypothetical protein
VEPQPFSSPLICPYPLMEEEALAWAILLFGQVYGLHPFPLPLTETFQNLADHGLLEVRTFPRSREEIRTKDRFLRDLQTFAAGLPVQSFLEYLNQTRFKKESERLDEIVRSLRGEPELEDRQAPSVLTGSFLLCLIHDWLIQEWAIDQSLARVEALETALTQGWQEELEEGTSQAVVRPQSFPRPVREIPCPLALGAWRVLRDSLFPEPRPLITTQQWVWADYYGIDLREGLTHSIALPGLGPDWMKAREDWEAQGQGKTLRKKFAGLLSHLTGLEMERKLVEFQESLAALGLSPQGPYRLILPPPARINPLDRDFERAGEIMLLLILESL